MVNMHMGWDIEHRGSGNSLWTESGNEVVGKGDSAKSVWLGQLEIERVGIITHISAVY